MPTRPAARPGPLTSLSDHEDRIRALERHLPAAENDFVECVGPFTVASAPGPPPAPTGVPITIDGQTPGSEATYYISTGFPGTYLTIADPGFHVVKAIVFFPEGMTGYLSVAAVIGGDAILFQTLAPRFVPASYPGNVGGGFMEVEQTIQVLDTAVPGTATEVGVYPTVWQNSGVDRAGTAYIQVVRLS